MAGLVQLWDRLFPPRLDLHRNAVTVLNIALNLIFISLTLNPLVN